MGGVRNVLSLGAVLVGNVRGASTVPITSHPLIAPTLRSTFGPVRAQHWWEGERARYARLTTHDQRELFLKYRPAFDFHERAYRRFRNEQLYLSAFAPHVSVPHAALQHAAWNDTSRKAHLILEDLTGGTLEWGEFTETQKHAHLPRVIQLVAAFHAAWFRHPLLPSHPSAPWTAGARLERARQSLSLTPDIPMPEVITRAVRALNDPALLEGVLTPARAVTLVHGDLHFQQFLFSRQDPRSVYLIDYEHTRVAPLGVDLAHLLGVRFSWLERRHLERDLLDLYRSAMNTHGIVLSEAEVLDEYRAGLLLNFVTLWARLTREPTPLFRDLVLRVHAALTEHAIASH